VRALISSAGAITDSYAFKAFGEELAISESTVNPHRYVGQYGYYRDTATRQYVRARHLDVSVGRWMSRDPLGPGKGRNMYSYANASPLLLRDPSGQVPVLPFFFAGAGALLLMGCRRRPLTCREVCAMAAESPAVRAEMARFQIGGGTIICYRHLRCPCLIPDRNQQGRIFQPPVGVCPSLDACAQAHEDQHVPDTKPCDTKRQDLYVAEPLVPGWVPVAECLLRTQEVGCLRRALAQRGLSPVCARWIRNRIERRRAWILNEPLCLPSEKKAVK
jgi:RHS repeat-associated protein